MPFQPFLSVVLRGSERLHVGLAAYYVPAPAACYRGVVPQPECRAVEGMDETGVGVGADSEVFGLLCRTQEDGLTGNKVRVALESASGDLYVGTTNGLNVIKKNTGRIITYTKSEGLVNDYIMCLYEDSDGRMWCGTDGGGVFVLHNGRIEKVIYKLQNIELCEIDNVSYNSNTNFLKLKENDAYSEVLISFKLNIKVMFKFI